MADSNNPYLELITSEYANKKKYNDYVEAFLKYISPTVDNLDDFNGLFNLDTAAGDQLDSIGSLLNVSRNLPTDNPNIPSTLPDDLYRKVLKSRIYMNHWDGTRKGLEEILNIIFPDVPIDFVDNQDMSYVIRVIDPNFSQTDLALLQLGYILPKPSGVRVNYEIQDKPLFGWDTNTSFIKGWDEGNWSST